MTERAPAGTVLLVEDHADLRDLLTLTLQREGYVVVPASSAAEALRFLQTDRYALVIAHYTLPDRTGLALLRQALAEGRLEGTRAMILTARPEGVQDARFPVLKKPLDIQSFVDQVRRLAVPHRSPDAPERRRHQNVRAELTLYYTPPWPNSLRAHEVLHRVLAAFEPAQVSLTLCDLSQDCQAADTDSIVFSPTLVKSAPAPPLWLVGDLGDGSAVVDLLQLCGVQERQARRGSDRS